MYIRISMIMGVVLILSNFILACSPNNIQVIQAGNNNLGIATQTGLSNAAIIEQIGYDQTACQTQIGYYNTAEIFQNGSNNSKDTSACDVCYECLCTCSQYQDGLHNQAYTFVIGDDNNTQQFQWGDSNEALIDITGQSNTASQCQVGDLDYAEIWQNGDFNIACQKQSGGDSSVISQYGNYNNACVIQNM